MVAAVSNTDNEVLIDVGEATKHLRLLGYTDHCPVVLCAYGKTNLFHPKRKSFTAAYDWEAVTKDAAKNGRAGLFHKLQKDLVNSKTDTPNLGFISSPGGTKTLTKEITKSKLVVYEIDADDDEEKLASWCSWETANLPAPTAVMDTGNKSYHVWYQLDEYITAEKMTDLRKRINQTVYNYCGFTCDGALTSCHQPTRLAGGIHPKTGLRSKIVFQTGKVFTYKELYDLTDEVEPERDTGEGRGELWRTDNNPIDESKYPKAGEVNIALPITVALSNKTKELIETGIPSGAKKGNRYNKCFSLSQTLQAARHQLEDLGYQVQEGHVEQLYEEFCKNCNLYDGDLKQAYRRHFAPYGQDNFTCGELNKSSVKRAIAAYCFKAGIWNPPKTDKSELNVTHLVNRSLRYRMDFFSKYVTRTVKLHRNSLRRFAYLRDVLKKLKLKESIKENQLSEMIMTAQDELAGNSYQSIDAATRIAEGVPEIEWLVEDRIPANDLTIVGGRPKVGKTRLVVGLAKSLLTGEPFLGVKPAGLSNVILITDDQSAADSGQMFKAAGIFNHPNLYWSKKFRYTEKDLDKLLLDIKYYEKPVVILDCFRSITRSTGVKENDSAAGVICYDMKHAITEAGGSFILLHHANKDSNAVGADALSGSTAIAGAANTVLTVNYLEDKDNPNKLLKSSKDRRLVREARSGNDFDLVASLNFDCSFDVVCTYEELQDKKLEEDQTNQLKRLPKDFEAILGVMYRRFTDKEPAVSPIDLMKEAKLCRKSVEKKKDLTKAENNTYVTVNRKISEFIAAGHVVEIQDQQIKLFAPRKRALSLTEKGAEFVSKLILDF